MNDVLDFLKQQQPITLEQLCSFLRIPSVSADSAFAPQMTNCAEWVKASMEEAGLTATIYPTKGHPIVFGERIHDPALPTVLVYGHYDVQPPDPLNLWTTPPFEPQVRDGKLFARGATDDKGQLFTHLKSIEAWTKVQGQLPVNVKCLIEGEFLHPHIVSTMIARPYVSPAMTQGIRPRPKEGTTFIVSAAGESPVT